MYINYKNYSADYNEKTQTFSCYYRPDGSSEEQPFIRDAQIKIATREGQPVPLSRYKVATAVRTGIDHVMLEAVFSVDSDPSDRLTLQFTADAGSLKVWAVSIKTDISIDGPIHWGAEPETSTFGVRLNAEGGTLRCACGPAFSIHDNALFDRNLDRVLEFRANEKYRVFYDWEAGGYRLRFGSGEIDGRAHSIAFAVQEDYCKRRFNIPYAPINKSHGFKTPPVGWMTWYAVKFGASEQVVLENARGLAANFANYTDKLCLWVDWEWDHVGFDGLGGDFDTFSPRKDAYPNGLAHVADEIGKLGLIPALWIGATNDGRKNAMLEEHPEWVLAQKPEWCGQWWVDPTHPGVVSKYIPAIFKQILDWGYQAIKWDCLPASLDVYDAFHSKFHDPKISSDSGLRRLIKAARRTVGPDVYMLSCAGISERDITVGMDLFDAARIGNDIYGWEEFLENCVNRILRLYLWHNVVFYADGDNVVVRGEFNNLAQARSRISFYGVAGLPVTFGDAYCDLDAPRIDMLRRIVPVADIHPMDLHRKNPSEDYVLANLAVCKPYGAWNVVDLFNKKETPLTLNLSLEHDLDLPTKGWQRYAVYSFWDRKFLGVYEDLLTVEVAPADSTVLRITPLEARPQLISTSRHITQGACDLEDLSWDAAAKTLRGRSRLVAGEGYQLAVYVPEGYEFTEAQLAGGETAEAGFDAKSRQLSVELAAKENRAFDWELRFK